MLTGSIPHEGLAQGPLTIKAFKGELCLPIEESTPEKFKELLSGKFKVYAHLQMFCACVLEAYTCDTLNLVVCIFV